MPGPFDDVPIVPQVPLVNSNTQAAADDDHEPPARTTPAAPAKKARPLWQYVLGTVIVAKLLRPKGRIW